MAEENKQHAHAEKHYSIFQIGINLTLACLLSGAIIAGTYLFTAPIAAQEAIRMKNEAMRGLVPDANNFKEVSGKKDWYEAEKDGKAIAYVIPAESKGYGGSIKMLAAIDMQGKVMDYKILTSNETPGLGDKAAHPQFRDQFKGKTAEELEVVKVPTTKNIQALTGATITSRAVTKGIREAVEEVNIYLGQKK